MDNFQGVFSQVEVDLLQRWNNDVCPQRNEVTIRNIKNKVFHYLCECAPYVNWRNILPMKLSVECGNVMSIYIFGMNGGDYSMDINRNNEIEYISELHEKLGENDAMYKFFNNSMTIEPIKVGDSFFKGLPLENYDIFAHGRSQYAIYETTVTEDESINSEYPSDTVHRTYMLRIVNHHCTCGNCEECNMPRTYTRSQISDFNIDDSWMQVYSDHLNDNGIFIIGYIYENFVPTVSAYFFDTDSKICLYNYVNLSLPKLCNVEPKIVKMYQDGSKVKFLYEDASTDNIESPIYMKHEIENVCLSEFEVSEFNVDDLINNLQSDLNNVRQNINVINDE